MKHTGASVHPAIGSTLWPGSLSHFNKIPSEVPSSVLTSSPVEPPPSFERVPEGHANTRAQVLRHELQHIQLNIQHMRSSLRQAAFRCRLEGPILHAASSSDTCLTLVTLLDQRRPPPPGPRKVRKEDSMER